MESGPCLGWMEAVVSMSHESASRSTPDHPPPDFAGTDGGDLIGAAIRHLGGSLSGNGTASWSIPIARQKESLREWAGSVGLLLKANDLPSKSVRGGMEHDLFHDEGTDRYFKVTRQGIFGLSPGMDLAMVSSSQDARRFQLWEATPLEYLERLRLHNELVPGINRLEGIICQANDDLAVVTSQPRFDIHPVSAEEITDWFAAQGFRRVTDSAYYREEDNLGIFDAHDKNVVRAGEILIPFDVIPCHPEGGFLRFIADTLAAGHRLSVVRTVTTGKSPLAGKP